MRKVLKSLCAVIFLFPILINGQSKVGTTAGNFLTIPVGARASAMGGAFIAVADDGTTSYWNIGGLSRLKQGEVSLAYTQWFVGTDHNWLSLAIKTDADNAIGISFNQLDYGEEEITTERRPDGTGQMWSASDISIGLSYARNLTDRFSIGGTVKYIQQKIWNETASCFALDVGLLFITQLEGMKIGMNISNFGTEMKMDGKDLRQPVDVDPSNTGNNEHVVATLETDSWNLPLTFSLGVSYEAVNNSDWKLTLATDAVYPNNNNSYLNVGTELVWDNLLYARTGYHSLFNQSAEEGFSIGMGIGYSFGSFSARIDYSYMEYGIFEGISRYGISILF